jgi:hypothetical protein
MRLPLAGLGELQAASPRCRVRESYTDCPGRVPRTFLSMAGPCKIAPMSNAPLAQPDSGSARTGEPFHG